MRMQVYVYKPFRWPVGLLVFRFILYAGCMVMVNAITRMPNPSLWWYWLGMFLVVGAFDIRSAYQKHRRELDRIESLTRARLRDLGLLG